MNINDNFITVFTPTYNRAYILGELYESLIKQKYKNFMWLIIDDGSTDDTKSLVEQWQLDGLIDIKYVYQENHGRFSAFNTAKQFFKGDLLLSVDSDDYVTDGALNIISEFWNDYEYKNQVCGIIAYLEGEDYKIIGSEFPVQLEKERCYVLYDKYHMSGDKSMIFKISSLENLEYPVYENERFTGDSIVFNKANETAPMVILRQCVAHREYIKDGLTKNMKEHHKSSPRGMRDHYLDSLQHEEIQFLNIVKHIIGYIAFGIKSGDSINKLLKACEHKMLFILLIIPGLIYYLLNLI